MTRKEIEIIVEDDEIYDLLMYIYCLSRAPHQFANVTNVDSELRQAERAFLDRLKILRNAF